MDESLGPLYSEELTDESLRLLELNVQDGDDGVKRLQCQLSVHSVTDTPRYVALSYTWDDPDARAEAAASRIKSCAQLNGQPVQATPNLILALEHIAAKERNHDTVYFWIDALCINQQSDRERTAQVSIMHLIYRNAAVVSAWLGPDVRGDTYVVREFLRALLQRYFFVSEHNLADAEKYDAHFASTDHEQALLEHNLPSLASPIWSQVIKFWDRAWFFRTWVQQEVGLSRLARFWCGEIMFTFTELTEASRFFLLSGLSETLQIERSRVAYPGRISAKGYKVGVNACRLMGWQARHVGFELFPVPDIQRSAERLAGPAKYDSSDQLLDPILRLFAIELFQSFLYDCTDPRDRIFALLVLINEIARSRGFEPVPLHIDYAADMPAVFTQAVALIIEKTGWLGILSIIDPGRRVDDVQELPSWVPDLRADMVDPLLIFDPSVHGQIASHYAMMTAATRPLIDGFRLLVSVKLVGCVSGVGDAGDDCSEHGKLDATAELLLQMPEEVIPGYLRIDYWADTISCSEMTPADVRSARRDLLRHWLRWTLMNFMKREHLAGRLARGREHLATMPNLETLAKADSSRTLPTLQDWLELHASQNDDTRLMASRPHFKHEFSPRRRLFRFLVSGFPVCPSACMLGLGPEAVRPGDQVYQIVGSAMPLVLRSTGITGSHAPLQARVIGEAFLVGFDNIILPPMADRPFERCEIV